ncbi:MAG: YqjK family protein [Candidatus Eiseniibacteriota bacterium]
MSAAREALLARRARLIERAAHEREELARLADMLERPLIAVDRSVTFVRALKRSRWLSAAAGAGMAALAFVRPRSIIGWVAAGRAGWQLLTGVRRSI